ncbi:hypothetical protein [Serpentinicella alkaliphila]|uniref:Uncharacterized protein n=1 Tax=Serpentinicella alkaliphila TaxID=1734049 RepID=A0A4R2T9F0_9FIRM|nr:hypothetical protein [Serpentinicella alkaliphila]QUH26121.1 hypothetical protein HZR23_10485 [Serpentinicella alkaliphila]TCP98431.1 hypothetical protein EDD79_104013 [Serpentinicella alkaliphila]
MNIQNLGNFKSLSSDGKRDVLQNLLMLENSQYNENGYNGIDYTSEFAEEFAINYQGDKKRIVNTAFDKKDIPNQVSINDILYEYNPNSQGNLTSKTNNSNNNFIMNENMDAFSLNVAMDDFVT